MYVSLKQGLCNLVHLLQAEAIPPLKSVQIPAHVPLYVWCSQNKDSKLTWSANSADLDPFSTGMVGASKRAETPAN